MSRYDDPPLPPDPIDEDEATEIEHARETWIDAEIDRARDDLDAEQDADEMTELTRGW